MGKKSQKSRDLGYGIWDPRKIPSQSHFCWKPRKSITDLIYDGNKKYGPHSEMFGELGIPRFRRMRIVPHEEFFFRHYLKIVFLRIVRIKIITKFRNLN